MSELLLSVTKTMECDVLVLGGGVSGISAGICAARKGMKVIIADRNGCLGGTATVGMVGPFMTSFNPASTIQVIQGFFDEFVRRMESEGGAVHPSKAPLGTSYTAYRVPGHQNVTAFHGETMKRVAEEMCVEEGIRLLYHVNFVKADVEDGNIKAAYFVCKRQVIKVVAKVFIDCSGDADLAAESGVPIVFGDGKGGVQPASLFFKVRGVDKEKMDAHMFRDNNVQRQFYMQEIIEEREKGNFPIHRAKIMLFESFHDEWLVNMSQIEGVDANDCVEVTDAEIEGRQQMVYIMNFLRKYVAGCENIVVCDSAESLGVRESNTIEGVYRVKTTDMRNRVKFEDSVMCCCNTEDLHQKGGVTGFRPVEEPYYIPYRALLPLNVENLLVAGRCISCEREVSSAVRVMPPCFALGQAAGVAAAMAVKEECSPKAIDVKQLVDTLVADGVYLG